MAYGCFGSFLPKHDTIVWGFAVLFYNILVFYFSRSLELDNVNEKICYNYVWQHLQRLGNNMSSCTIHQKSTTQTYLNTQKQLLVVYQEQEQSVH